MGLLQSFQSGLRNILGLGGPLTQIIPPQENFDFWQPQTQIIRDTGLQSRTLREALEVLQEAAPTLPGLSLFMDKYGFRSLTQNIRDINESVRQNLLNRAETLSRTNGMAHRALQIRTDLIVSEGFRVEADPDKDCPAHIRQRIQDVLDEHWELNEWKDRTYERVLDIGRTGELIRRIPPLGTKILGCDDFKLGRFICGNIAPQLVYGVSLDPWNYEKMDRLYLEQYAFPNAASKDLSLKILCDERLSNKEFGSIRGDCLYYGVNRAPGCSRGITDLAAAMDWLEIYDQMLMMDCKRAEMMMRFIWDVSIENASPAHIKAYAEALKATGGPAPGTVRVHSSKETWDAVSPDLKLSDSKDLREDIFIYAWGAMGLPRPWYSDGENANRASIENMTDPNFAWARTRRRSFVSHLELEHRYALQVAYDSGRFPDIPIHKLPEWLKLKITSRDPDRKGYESVGSAWNDIANALTVFVTQQMIDQQTAADIVRKVIGAYGFEIDPDRMKVNNAYADGTQGQLDSSAQATDPSAQTNGITTNNGQSIGANLNQAAGTSGLRRESRGKFSLQKIRPRGIMGSRDPFAAMLEEANKSLQESHKRQRKLLKHF